MQQSHKMRRLGVTGNLVTGETPKRAAKGKGKGCVTTNIRMKAYDAKMHTCGHGPGPSYTRP